MNTLRVLCARDGDGVRAVGWALFDDAGRLLSQSASAADATPGAERIEAVLAAATVRLIALKLPPLPAARRLNAARYALEDRLATPSAELVVAVGTQAQDGTVLAAVTERSLLTALVADRDEFERVTPESALCPPRTDWVWCTSGAAGGFVRLPDGGAFAVDTPAAPGALPAELAAALSQAAKASTQPPQLLVAHRVDEAALELWSKSTGVRFQRAPPWHWSQASPEAFGAAPDLLEAEFPRTSTHSKPGIARLFRPAMLLVAAALVLHLAATLGQWAWLKVDLWRTSGATMALGTEAGVTVEGTSAEVAMAIAQRYARMRHAAGLYAPGDALPLLARVAPALGALPPAALKSAVYADGAWSFDFGALDPAALAALDRALASAGISALHAPTAGGVRFRISSTP